MDRITTQSSAAIYFGCHPRTVRRWIEECLVRGYRDGNMILVDLDEIEAGGLQPRVLGSIFSFGANVALAT